ncbi:MAG: DNA adenine methylase [Myxococcales bacterium]|nr:DNA adenine methylase [Myxococcales bacterium]
MASRSSSAQKLLFPEFPGSAQDSIHPFPSTRYQGSKKKIADWIWGNIRDLEFTTMLDAFGGTGCISHMLKSHGKSVTYNDLLTFNHIIGHALIENSDTTLSSEDIDFLLKKHEHVVYPDFIQKTFENIYFTSEENIWLDRIITNIQALFDKTKQTLALFALFQACIIKRPYNLFHRANLYVRTNDAVERSFGNKTTWDRPFEDHFRAFVEEANTAVFDNSQPCRSLNQDALTIPNEFDLIYIDPPYISQNGVGTDYLEFYHFLEGISRYGEWLGLIDTKYKHRPIRSEMKNPWTDKNQIKNKFDELFDHFKDSILVVSYRKDGIPSIETLEKLMKKHKRDVTIRESENYKYVLSKKTTQEVLLIGF